MNTDMIINLIAAVFLIIGISLIITILADFKRSLVAQGKPMATPVSNQKPCCGGCVQCGRRTKIEDDMEV